MSPLRTTEGMTKLLASIWVRHETSWRRPADILVRKDGQWISAYEGYVRHDTRWKRFWPPRQPPAVHTFDCVSSGKWHDYSDGWHGGIWGDRPEQGAHPVGNHRGVWFYGNRPWSNTLDADGGRRVTKVEIYLTRISGHMGWGASGGVRPRLWYHTHNSRPASRPALYGGPFEGAVLQRGESRWVELPSSWNRLFENGTLRGIGVHTPGGGPIAAFRGPHQSSVAGRLRIHHR